jgi:hypothetical protein
VNTGGSLTVNKRSLTVTADLKYIFKGDALPTYTSTYSGFVNNDQNTITTAPKYSISPSCTGAAGVYTITPYGMVLSNNNKYTISYVSNKLYINPKGSGAKNVVPKLTCVAPVTNHPSGYAYLAKFAYTNSNATPVYVPVGTSNNLAGTYSGTLPVVFQPGSGTFEIYFNGSSLKWTLTTYNGSQKTTCSVTATPSSTACPPVNYSRNGIQDQTPATAVKQPEPVKTTGKGISAYPNPVADKLIIVSTEPIASVQDIQVLDVSGKIYRGFPSRKMASGGMELNMAGLKTGMYFIRVRHGNEVEQLKIFKQ